ncbi:MAG: CpsB/CapC family capsule biosynthesis tyrosine phosphatase [Solirubrobacteraceae bacterium]
MSSDTPHVAVDLHCHILPGVDDGAVDMADAVAMARQAHADGIASVCATPHIRSDHDVRIADLARRVAELEHSVRASGCPTQILPGGEVAAGAVAHLTDAELAAVSLGGGGRWILLEPDPGPVDGRLTEAAEALGRRGRRAVIAHPERHLAADLVTRLAALVDGGALVQATAASFTAPESRDGMLWLAGAGVVHVLGSDAHSSHVGRPVAAREAVGVLSAVEPTASHLQWVARTAPAAIVRGDALRPPFPPRSP